MTLSQLTAEHRENQRHFRTLLAIDEAHIEQVMPPIPEYKVVKIPFTKLVIHAFAKEIHAVLTP